jgi:hypothetical protein
MGKAQYRAAGAATIGSILFKGMLIEFAIDTGDLERVRQHTWHYTTNGYIATTMRVPAAPAPSTPDVSGGAAAAPAPPAFKKREVYLHTFLLSPGEHQTVIHISKNGLDNRRSNLRIAEGPEAAAAAALLLKRKRSIELPPLYGISPEEIPRHIWYVQANGYHRDRFAIEFKAEKILWKSTSSKEVSLREKLEQAKEKLKEFYGLYPYLDPAKEEATAAANKASFEALLSFQQPAQV